MEKIKAFFKSNITKYVSWGVAATVTNALTVTGLVADKVSRFGVSVGGLIVTVALVIAFISERLTDE